MAYVFDNDNDNIWGGYYPTPNVLTPDHYNHHRGSPCIYRIPKQKRKRAVVSVPVHFIGSDSWKKSRSDYAVKIQKYFRGFRVRKSINKVLELNRAVDDVETGVAAAAELILRDDKERLKFNEALMALLFKLDAVTAVDDAVRVCRKNVIRKACLLLDRIDSIAKPAHSLVLQTPKVDGKPAQDDCSDDEDDDYTEDDCSDDQDDYSEDDCSEEDYEDDDDDDEEDHEDDCSEESLGKSSEVDDNAAVDQTAQDKGEVLSDEVAEETLEKPSQVEKAVSVDIEKEEEDEEEEADASDDDVKGWGADDDGEAWECVGEEDENMEFLDIGQGVGEKQRQGGWLVVKENKGSEDNLMVKLMEENQKLMKTVAELCNKTEEQAVLITKLFDRVKQLEVSVQELEDVNLFDSLRPLSISKADKGWGSFLPTAR